jgi:hypothetical protein
LQFQQHLPAAGVAVVVLRAAHGWRKRCR